MIRTHRTEYNINNYIPKYYNIRTKCINIYYYTGLLQHRRIGVGAQRIRSAPIKHNSINGMVYANENSFNHYNNNM